MVLDTVIIDNEEPLIAHSVPETEDHPTGIKLRRVGYYTIPPMNELTELIDEDGSCFVDGFTIGRYDFGNVYFPDRFNVAGLDLDTIGERTILLLLNMYHSSSISKISCDLIIFYFYFSSYKT